MEIKFTSESGYAQPTHKENEKSVLWQVWSVWPKEMPTKKLETKGSRWFYNRSQNCQFWWKNWVTLWNPSLGMSNKFHLLKPTWVSHIFIHFHEKKTSPCLFPCLPCLIPSPLSQGLFPVSPENPAGPPMGFDSSKCCISCRTAGGSKDQQTAAKSSSSQSFSSPVKLWPYMVNVGLFL